MSDTRPTGLYPALLAFQRAVGPVKKDASNPAFRTKYASLQSVLDTIEEPLWENGLVLLQRLDGLDGHTIPLLITEIIHAASGEKVESRVAVVCKDPNDPQKLGGALTYYRRYSLLALLGLAPEDDDGNAASKPAPPRQQPAAEQPRPTPASNGTPAPAAKPAAPANWTTVWAEAKARGYNTRADLDALMAPDKIDDRELWKVLARLKEAAAPAAPPPSH